MPDLVVARHAAALRALRRKLSTEMPVTGRLGIRLGGAAGGGVRLRAPLAANINHRGTAFAGSLNALATLTGWATVWLVLRAHGLQGQVVIQDSTVHYVRPVTGDFEARCEPPTRDAIHHLLESVKRRGRGRIELTVTVSDRQGPAVNFRGRYVALLGEA
jgi:thioesterase domain-containing protein